jgi:hypothetical protein
MAATVGASPEQISSVGQSMGLPAPAPISVAQQRRSYITIIRRNWHLLPYEQLLQLLDWTAEHMAYMLREDDFLFIKLGSLKPKCAPLRYTEPTAEVRRRARGIAETLKSLAPDAFTIPADALFSFVSDLSASPAAVESNPGPKPPPANSAPRFCTPTSRFTAIRCSNRNLIYPDGYLQRLAAVGVNGVWLQGVLQKLAPLPWLIENAAEREKRLNNLRVLARKNAFGRIR